MTRAHLAFVACLAPALSAFDAAAQEDADGAFDRTPRDCINVASIDETDAVDDQNLLFYMRDGRVYRNHLPRKCPGLQRENRISYKIDSSRRLCSINLITVLEDGIGGGVGIGGLRDGFTCRLGEFVPLSPEEVEDLKLLEDAPRGGRRTQSTIETSEVELPNDAGAEGEEPAPSEPEPQAGDRD
jgi:hypothetical protein